MQTYVERAIFPSIEKHLENFPCVALLGARQVGKSTLAKKYIQSVENAIYLDLEDPVDMAKLRDVSAFLEVNSDKLICFDEIQRYPDIFQVFRSYLDKGKRHGQLLLLGSASRDLIRQSFESLAGRISYLEVTPFLANEVGDFKKLWLQGGYPESYLKESEFSDEWRRNYIQSFLERDIPNLGIKIAPRNLRRFWQMLAHSNGQLLNKAKLASSMGMTAPTITHYLDILEGTFILTQLQAYSSNAKKRLVKSPKIYMNDTGLLHTLLGLETMNDLLGHPVFGSSFESVVVTNILKNFPKHEASFYRSSSGNEIDLVLEKGNRKICVEIKASSSPKVSKGFFEALKFLNPDEAFVVANIKDSFPVSNDVEACSLEDFLQKKIR